ncbi:MAG: M2 family metallopeptidase [Luteimonas sp.]
MTQIHRQIAFVIIAIATSLSACKRDTAPADPVIPKNETADAFIARVNAEYRAMYPELTASQWLSSTYIGGDSKLIAAKSNERFLTRLNQWLDQARRFEGQPMSPQTARAITLLKLGTAMPPPRDPAKLAQLTAIASDMEGNYGAGAYCKTVDGKRNCRQLGDLEDVLRSSRDYDRQLDAWQGWHATAMPMREDYATFVTLVNDGARDMGYADAGEMWRSGYDMVPAEFAADTDRLWTQVKPLYEQLHCYARTRLQARYQQRGAVGNTGLLPAHLMGNLWQQDWSNLWDLLAPYPGVDGLDIGTALQKQYQSGLNDLLVVESETMPATREADVVHIAQNDQARRMTERAQDFYVSLGMPKLPASYWQRSQFIKPRDRDVVCHASAWDMNLTGDVRTKMCIKPNAGDFATIYHELGHVYYYLAYNKRPLLFQTGANDGFHEAIGDTIVLAMTPGYLHAIGLIDQPQIDQQALIGTQMRMALSKVAFLPFGLMIDRWRWGVFDGSITPAGYNAAWWRLKAQYQGVAPATARGEQFFDAGAKYHVPANTPYTRYFLSHILQFQFYKALCDASGHRGPLYACSFYGSKAAGQKFQAMLEKGASQPWPQTMRELTGGETIDAAALLDYFAPLQGWLKQHNEGQSCGWMMPAVTASYQTDKAP